MSQPTVTIRTRENGPLVVSLDAGVEVRITDHLGNVFPIPPGKPSVALCRCGASHTKPFCDGQHKQCGFVAAETAVPPGTEPTPTGPAPTP
jgi:CDGSH-type Zn-finger protein